MGIEILSQGFHRLLEFLGRHVSVDGRRGDVPVAEAVLHQREVAGAFEQTSFKYLQH